MPSDGPQKRRFETTAAESTKSSTGRVILVTGTAGFVGYHCAKFFKKRGDGVLGLDNFNPYYPVGIKYDRAQDLEDSGVYTIKADLNDRSMLDHILQEYKVTHVLALAAQAGVRYATKDPASYVASNVAGFVQLLEACRFCDPQPRIVYASSSSVYGLNTVSPFSESHQVDKPASLYAATKKANEMIAHTYHHIYGLFMTGLRFFTVYGPWGRPDMFAFSATIKIHKGEALKIFQGPGGSELERDFTYIDDIVQGCVASVDRIPASTKETAHFKVYNLGNKDPVTVTYMIECLERAIGKKAIKNYVPMPHGRCAEDQRRRLAGNSAEKELDYKPTTSLQDGINKFIAWYDDYYKDGLTKEMASYVPY